MGSYAVYLSKYSRYMYRISFVIWENYKSYFLLLNRIIITNHTKI